MKKFLTLVFLIITFFSSQLRADPNAEANGLAQSIFGPDWKAQPIYSNAWVDGKWQSVIQGYRILNPKLDHNGAFIPMDDFHALLGNDRLEQRIRNPKGPPQIVVLAGHGGPRGSLGGFRNLDAAARKQAQFIAEMMRLRGLAPGDITAVLSSCYSKDNQEKYLRALNSEFAKLWRQYQLSLVPYVNRDRGTSQCNSALAPASMSGCKPPLIDRILGFFGGGGRGLPRLPQIMPRGGYTPAVFNAGVQTFGPAAAGAGLSILEDMTADTETNAGVVTDLLGSGESLGHIIEHVTECDFIPPGAAGSPCDPTASNFLDFEYSTMEALDEIFSSLTGGYLDGLLAY